MPQFSKEQDERLRQSLDKTSFAEPATVRCETIHLSLDVDFDKKVLSGYVDLTVQRIVEGDAPLKLDTRSLTIHEVAEKSSGQPLSYRLDEAGVLGTACLSVTLPLAASAVGSKCVVRVRYTTSPEATALQWLDAGQTADKQMPYLFTQCQAIHASSMLPCQDTPSVKCAYTAEITVPVGMQCLMSASDPGGLVETSPPAGKTVYRFEQTTPIASYLIAMAAGKMSSRRIGPRSLVWAEDSVVEKAAFEFAETEEMLKAAESIVGPYQWSNRYDLLVLPPSFPYGGMENPCLTFVTPSLLAGDRSLSSVVAHEISHSWTGNLVTNRTWEHFWLNEGFTTFLERKIVGRLYGEAHRHFAFIGGRKALQGSVDLLGPDSPLTALIPPLDGVDPDDAFSSVPYEKGSAFLFYLETLVGGPDEFEPFLLAYIQKFQGVTLTSGDFLDFFLSFFALKNLDGAFKDVAWETWFFSPGMPPVMPKYDESMVSVVTAVSKSIRACLLEPLGLTRAPLSSVLSPSLIDGFSSRQVVELLDQLLAMEIADGNDVSQLDAIFAFSKPSHNTEIHFRWLRLGMRAGLEDCFQAAKVFVSQQGRMKFVRPLYRDMFDRAVWLTEADSHFTKHSSFYHPIARTMIQRDYQNVISKVCP